MMALLLIVGCLAQPEPARAADSCEAAKNEYRALRKALPVACTDSKQCGMERVAYDSCNDPVGLNKDQVKPGQIEALNAAKTRARTACNYLAAPCPAYPFGDPICHAGTCTGTLVEGMNQPAPNKDQDAAPLPKSAPLPK